MFKRCLHHAAPHFGATGAITGETSYSRRKNRSFPVAIKFFLCAAAIIALPLAAHFWPKTNPDPAELLTAAILDADPAMAHTAQLRGASINVPSFGTPLTIYATIKPGTDMLKFLISNGAEVNQSMPNGYTPLMSAAFLGHADQVQLLLRAGANSNLHDSNNWTAADWARNGVSPDLANLLEHPTPAPPPSANRTAIISSTDGGTLAISFRS